MTVKAYLERWLKEKARTVKPRTAEVYRYSLTEYIVPHLGRVRLTKLTPLQLQDAISEITDAAGIRTANQARTILFQAIKQAVNWQLVPRNVVEAVDKLKDTPREMQLWTSEEATRFLDSIQGHRLYAAFYLDMSTGMRRSELLGLRWCDVQEDAINVRQALVPVRGGVIFGTLKTANGFCRVVTTPDVQDVLEAHRRRQQAEREALGDM